MSESDEQREGKAEGSDAPTQAAEAPAPDVVLTPKERRAARRAARVRPSRGPQSVQERVAERAELRARKASERRATRAKARARRRDTGSPPPPVEPVARPQGAPKLRQGVVVSDKPDKTIVVRIDMVRRHRRYGKIIRSSSTLHAHDESNQAGAGDTVSVVESRPLSRTKRWRLVDVLERAR